MDALHSMEHIPSYLIKVDNFFFFFEDFSSLDSKRLDLVSINLFKSITLDRYLGTGSCLISSNLAFLR